MNVKPEIQRLFDAKQSRREELARLPFPEKVLMIIQLQKMVAPLYRARGKKVRIWDPIWTSGRSRDRGCIRQSSFLPAP